MKSNQENATKLFRKLNIIVRDKPKENHDLLSREQSDNYDTKYRSSSNLLLTFVQREDDVSIRRRKTREIYVNKW